METSQHLLELEMPVGYRFVPTDEELVKYYLANKVLYKPLPVKIIREIDAHDLYSKHPKCLGTSHSVIYILLHLDYMLILYG